MITATATATVVYGTNVRKRCATRPAGDSERRLFLPINHKAAHTIVIATGIGVESRLA